MQGIYYFNWEVRRSSDLEGLFVEDSEVVKRCVGKELYLGEVAGKHSDVSGIIQEGDIILKSDKPEDVEFFQRLSLDIGINPVAVLRSRVFDEAFFGGDQENPYEEDSIEYLFWEEGREEHREYEASLKKLDPEPEEE